MDATGASLAGSLAGNSLWGVIRSGKPSPRRELLAENTLWGREQQAVVSWPYKLILDTKSGRRQLYDLEADPEETLDLAAATRQTHLNANLDAVIGNPPEA